MADIRCFECYLENEPVVGFINGSGYNIFLCKKCMYKKINSITEKKILLKKEKEYMPTTTCDGCGGVAFVSDEETPTCISCKGDTCQECGECDCECQCCEIHHIPDCEKCSQ